MREKTYRYTYDDYEDNNKSAKTMVPDILADPEFKELERIEIGCWGSPFEESCQPVIDGIIANKSAFSHIRELEIGVMDFEECEMSWIMQGDYSKLYEALPNLKSLGIQGSSELSLGKIAHEGLTQLRIVCGGLPSAVIKSIEEASLPSLERLELYLGVENYGFDGDIETILSLLKNSNFPKLTHLGLKDSEIQDEVTKAVLECKYIGQLEKLDLSCGSLTDKGGQLLLDTIPKYPNIKALDLHYHYLSGRMMKKLAGLSIEVDVDEQNEPDDYDGELYYDPLITE